MAGRTLALLEVAERHLTSNPDKALEALVQAWAASPSVELAVLVERFEAAHPPAAFEGDTAEFVARARKPSLPELGSLARAILGPKSADTMLRVEALERLPPDPRVARALERIVREVPYTSNTARPVMSRLLALFAKVIDGAIAARVPEIEAGWKFRENQRDWMHTHLGRAVAGVEREAIVLEPAALSRIAALSAKLVPANAPKKGERTEEALLAEVYAAPYDDAPRLVLADFLLEKGDPRGELITLQFKGDKSKAELAREKALIAEHGKRWLGGIADVVLKEVGFRRGFPAVVTARFRHHRDVEAHGEAPEWSTIEEISWTTPGSFSEDQARFLYHVPKPLRPRVLATTEAGIEQLLERREPLPTEDLQLTRFDDVELLARLKASPLFAAVKRFRFHQGLAPEDFADGWLSRVPELVSTAELPLASWLPSCSARPTVTRLTVERRWLGKFHFVRGEDGLLSRLVIEPEGKWNKYSLQILSDIPDGWLTDVEVPKEQRPFVDEALTRARRKKGAKPPAVATPKPVEPELSSVEAMSWRDDGIRVVASGRFFVVDPKTAERSRERRINQAGCAAFTPDGRLLLCGVGAELEVRDGATGELKTQVKLPGIASEIAVDATSDGLAIKCSKEVLVGRLSDNGLEVVRTFSVGKHPGNVRFLGLDDGLLATTYGAPKLGLHAGKKTPTRLSLPSLATGVLLLPKGPILVTCVRGEVQLFERTGKPLAEATLKDPWEAKLSPDGQRVAVLTRSALQVLALPTLKKAKTLPEGVGKGFAFAPDGRRLAAVVDGAVRVFEL